MKDDDTIDLRDNSDKDDDGEFHIKNIEEDDGAVLGKVEAVQSSDFGEAGSKSSDKVKVKFDKFVNLVATHAYEDIFEDHADEDIIINTSLLTDLANAHEEKGDKKVPMIFIIGIILGGILTWLLFTFTK